MTKIQALTQHVQEAYAELPGSRPYAVDETAARSLAAAMAAWLESRKTEGESGYSIPAVKEFLASLAKYVPEMVQERPGDPPPKPELWTDPISGEPLRNPWTDPPDLRSQAAVTEADPELAAHLQLTAQQVGGKPSYHQIAEQRKREATRQAAANIRYSAAEHETNPFRIGDMSAQARLAKESPETAEFYRREARPLRLPWHPASKNYSTIARITSKSPKTGALIQRASEIERQWVQAEMTSAQQAREKADADYRKAQEILHGNKK